MSDDHFSPEFGTPFQVLVDHCESAGLKFKADPEAKGVFFSVRGDAAIYDVALLVTHDDEVLQIYANVPVAIADEKLRPLVAEFVVRANFRLAIGGFDFDMDEGKLCFHVGHAFGERGLDDEAVGRLLATALGTADRYFPALMRVMYGGHTPADAVYLSELDQQADADEAEKPAAPQSEPPSGTKPAAPKKKARRPRRDPRLKSTKELPGLFDKGGKEKGTRGENPAPKDNPPPSAS